MTALLALACAGLGLVVGSFLAVVVHRVPRKEELGWPWRCPSCQAGLAAGDVVPVLSFLRLGRHCRACAAPIPVRDVLVEVGTAALFAAAAARFGADWALPAFLVFLAALTALAVIDLEHLLLPSRVIYPTLGAAVPLLVLAAALGHHWHWLTTAAIGSAAAFGAFFLLNLVYPRGMAFGDVRLSSVIGLYLGWLGLGTLLVGMSVAFLTAAAVGVLLILAGRASRTSPIPFGVFLAIGAAVAVFAGTPILHWYRGG